MRNWRLTAAVLPTGLLLLTPACSTGTSATNDQLIAFTRQNASAKDQIYVVRSDGGGERALTTARADDYDPAWSPDGKRIAFLNADDLLSVMDGDGSHPRSLSHGFEVDRRASWSPDGGRLVLGVDTFSLPPRHEIDVVNLRSGRRVKVHHYGLSPAWSPDGRRIVFVDKRRQVALISSTGGGFRELTKRGCNDSPTWSPNGKQIAYTATVGSSCAGFASAIFVINADGSGRHALTHPTLGVYDQSPAWSPDGKAIAFQRGDPFFGDIYTIRIADARLQRLTDTPRHHDFDPSWQPRTLR